MAKFGRRAFLKTAGAALVTAVAAPLFIPSDRLDFGVPRAVSTETLTSGEIQALWGRYVERFDGLQQRATQRIVGQVPMLLVQNEYMTTYGGKLAAGSRVLVDQATSDRWLAYGVAVPDRGHPQYGQPLPERRNPDERGYGTASALSWKNTTTDFEAVGQLSWSDFAVKHASTPAYLESREMNRRMLAEIKRVRQTSGGVLVKNGAG